MPLGSGAGRTRQYEHIKESAQERGVSEERAEEIAARTVHGERVRAGESRTASRTSPEDGPSSRSGGPRSHGGAAGPTRDQLYEEARKKNVHGRSGMTKAQLARAVGR
ncbi:plasmid stabilization protein [Streptomyces sp. NPDC058195]|uniref:plasmid stabilization protein n=1 Tax=Streptomyces sp. NPDC058195 TaxID=3346375 RepID=UPI0036F13BC6